VWLAWLVGLAALTALLVAGRGRLSVAHVVLAYLLLSQIASATGGRTIGMALAGLSFVCFDYFFLPPFGTMTVRDPLDWIVLGAFLASSALTAQLLHQWRREAAAARNRADEVERLAFQASEADALREASRLKDALLASVSHDLRTPLTTIKALAQESAAMGDDRARAIEEEADRLGQFVTDLLDLSRLRGGAMELRLEDNEAEDLIGATLQRVSGLAAGREIVTSLDPAHPLLFARFDFSATVRALANLIENALKYSPAPQPISLRVHRDGGWIAFEVADRGPGIADADVERLFAPFVRGRHETPDVGGSGLGLTIAGGIADSEGGSVTYLAREGGGSVFTLRLPAVDIETPATE
jgi:two-component system sensor histidine kinase KdpD